MELFLSTGLLCGFDPTLRPIGPQPPPAAVPYDLPADAPLLERESGWPNGYASEHFVIRWGDEAHPPLGAEVAIAADLEDAWTHQVDELGWIRPRGTETHKVDVYLGNTHTSGPTIDFDGGYVTTGFADDVPYVVLSPSIVDGYGTNRESSSRQVIAHEFNHTLQLGDDLYGGDRGAFWFEASANWAAASTTVDPDEIASWGGFLLHPELAVYTFASIDDFSEPERFQRQYQAAMFVRFLSDHFGDDLIRRSWDEVEAGIPSPLPWLDEQLPEGIRPLYADFAATHAVGDTPYAPLYSDGAGQQAYFSANAGVTARIEHEGGAGEVDTALLPEAFGWNRLAWTALEAGEVVFRQDAEEQGSRGSPAEWMNTAVIERRGAFSYTPFDDEVTLLVEPGDFVSFVLVSVPERHADRERFAYGYDLQVQAEEQRAACGCANPASTDPSWLTLWRRR